MTVRINHGISLVAYLPKNLIKIIPFNGTITAYGKEFAPKVMIAPNLHVTIASMRISKGEQYLGKEFEGISNELTSIWPPKTTSFELIYDQIVLKNDSGKGTRVQLVAKSENLGSLRQELSRFEERSFDDTYKHISTLTLVTCFGDVGQEYESILARVNKALKDTLPLAVKIEKLSLVYHNDSVHSRIFKKEDYFLSI